MQKACEGAQGRHYQIPPMEKDHMELRATAGPAVGDRAERLLSDVTGSQYTYQECFDSIHPDWERVFC